MRNIRLILEYEGTRYHGWQVQPDVPTVQGTLEERLSRITGEKASVTGAGRTDAGVHALGQVANFLTASRAPLSAFSLGLNSLLPPDITVIRAEDAPPDFDARRSARKKLYRYRILNRPVPSALRRDFSWWVHEPLDIAAMEASARVLIGPHDFSAFRDSDPDMPDPHRTVISCSPRREDDMIIIEIEADGFLKHMVRIIMGTLALVGRGKGSPAWVAEILEACDRRRAGPTAPARGLCLVEVGY